MTPKMPSVLIVEKQENPALTSIVWREHMLGVLVKRNVGIPTNK